jgi:hypothetical protein
MSELTERVKLLLENVKITALIQDSVLQGISITQPQIITLAKTIDDLYEHEMFSTYVSPEYMSRLLTDERTKALDDVDTLLQRIESYYKQGKPTERNVISKVREEFNALKGSGLSL